MSRPSTTSSNSANAFPRPAGVNLLAPETAVDHLSPSRSTFSFESSPKSHLEVERHPNFDGRRPASQGVQSAGNGVQPNGSRRRAQYYEEQFAYKDDSTSSARDRVTRDAPIIAELRTNVIIKDEYTLVTDLSHHLSIRYQRPESSIMITVNHSACLLFGGSFEPTYFLTITALPVQVQQTTNKRNAALIQNFMFESLGVPLERGIVKFVSIQEECIATNGTTILGEIENLERQLGEENSGLKPGLTKGSKRSAVTKAKSSFQLTRNTPSNTDSGARAVITPPLPSPSPLDSGVAVDCEESDVLRPINSKFTNKPGAGAVAAVTRKASKSFSGKTATPDLPPPPVPADAPTPRMGKRKSMMNIFKR
ncbi:Tautomerase/MIF [Bimuria novae-zelandiae CBS 107.79]|uniref:L-dopachrome isomerase n=1 Tax=Bimuria novae-zelandiae CBS 107.79 TaxID=1447943 RepID=A0A6A5W3N9_9PLEO|nr:Tautomerase/MIF [Bimuria novae-zelandiae CBS 107.79]